MSLMSARAKQSEARKVKVYLKFHPKKLTTFNMFLNKIVVIIFDQNIRI